MNTKLRTSASYHHSCSPIFPCVMTYDFGDVIETATSAEHGVKYYELCLYHKGDYARNEKTPFIFEKIDDLLGFALLQNETYNIIFPWIIIGFNKNADEEIWDLLSNKVKLFVEMINSFLK